MNNETELVKYAYQLGYFAAAGEPGMEKQAGLFSKLLCLLGLAGLGYAGYHGYKNSPQFRSFVDNTGQSIQNGIQKGNQWVKNLFNNKQPEGSLPKAQPAVVNKPE
jgi:hypothetical protein